MNTPRPSCLAQAKRLLSLLTIMSAAALAPSNAEAAIININSYPRLGGETEDGPRFNRAITALGSGDTLQLNASTTYSIVTAITAWKSNMTLQGVTSPVWSSVIKQNANGFNLIGASGKTGIIIRDLKLWGYAQTGGGSNAVNFDNCNSCQLINVRIESFPWQGIVLGGSSSSNTVSGVTVTNCKTGVNGGRALLLYSPAGNGINNTINNFTAQYCGVGLSVNFGKSNTIGTVTTNDCYLMGFTLDGVAVGDGAENNTIDNLTALRNGGGVGIGAHNYGGVYLGNDSRNNVFNTMWVTDSIYAGLAMRVSASANNEFKTMTVSHNDFGIYNYSGSGNKFGSIGLTANTNAKNGVHLADGGGHTIGNSGAGAQSRFNSENGMYFGPLSDNNTTRKMNASSNTLIGVKVAAGSTGNVFYTLTATSNGGGNTYWGSPVTLLP